MSDRYDHILSLTVEQLKEHEKAQSEYYRKQRIEKENEQKALYEMAQREADIKERRELFKQVALKTIYWSKYCDDFAWSMDKACSITEAILSAASEFARGDNNG